MFDLVFHCLGAAGTAPLVAGVALLTAAFVAAGHAVRPHARRPV